MKYGFIARHRTVWPVRVMCRVMTVSASGYYDWAARSPSHRSQTNLHLTTRIREKFAASDRTYGSPRVWQDLQDWGEACSVNRVARLMQAAQLKARSKRRRLPGDTGQRPEHSIAANILDRQFEAAEPNQRWVADFTYVWTTEGWLHVAVVLDLYSRRAVDWSMSSSMTAQLVIDALMMALWRRGKPTQLMHHSDQGSQGVSIRYSERLAKAGIESSVGSKGDRYDNALAETINGLYKTELIHRRAPWKTKESLELATLEWVSWFNHHRLLEPIGYIPPAEAEENYYRQLASRAAVSA